MKAPAKLKVASTIAVAGAFALAVAGCAPAGSNAPIKSQTTQSAKFTPLGQVATCPNGPQGQLNQVGDIGGPYAKNFNPFSPSANTGAQQAFVYESLFQFSLSQPDVVQPWLATGYTWSDGGKTLDLKLRQGVNWSDGQPFSSDDVVYTYNLLKKEPATNLKGIQFSSIKATGKYGVQLTFDSPQYTQLFYLGTQYIVPAHIWSKIADPSKALNLDPIGTGPYLLKTLTTQSLILEANPNYWQKGAPCIKTVSAPPYVSNTTADLEMEQGKGDWGGLFVAGMSRYTSKPGHEFWNPPTNDVALYPNLTKAPLNNLALRQAISTVLDRPKIEQLGEQGEETPISNQTGVILPRDKAQLAPQYANATFTPDAAKAKSILTKAGYKYDGSTLMGPDGKPVSFAITVPSAFSDWVNAVQEVSAELKTIGIAASVNAIANPQWVLNMQTGKFDMVMSAGFLGPNSFYQYNGWLSSAETAPVGKVATNNFERYSDPKTDALIKTYLGTNDKATQNKVMADLEGVMIKDQPVIPLYYATDWGLYVTTRISGWASQQDPYEIASSYDTPMNEVVLLHLKWKG